MTIQEVPPREKAASRFDMSKSHSRAFEDIYELGAKIHRGSFAVVRECRHRTWDEKYAVKIIERDGKEKIGQYSQVDT